MSIVKGLILILFFILLYVIFVLKQENLKQKEFFIKTLSHDFRVAILAQLRGFDALSKTINQDLINTELMSEIKHSCLYSLDMISMLQNIFMFETGEYFIVYEKFYLQSIIKTIKEILKEKLNDKKLEIFFNLDNSPKVCGDKNLITKLILNILITSINYAEKNSTIHITSQLEKGIWKLTVSYFGETLSEEEFGRMFSKQTHFSTVGHGIKMYFCKKIVDFHNGKIYIKKNSDNISFMVSIPQHKVINVPKRPALTALQFD